MNSWRTNWVSEKKGIALRLAHGDRGGTYGEAMLILCAVLSALAAEVWLGKRIDQKRFVELLKDYAPVNFNTTKISIPMLVWHLGQNGKSTEAQVIRKSLLNFCQTRVLTGEDIDQTESEILILCNSISVKDMRECSYANILYREVRSGYAHEYQPGKRADSLPMTQDINSAVSYINRLGDPDRLVHLHVGWVADLAIAVAKAMDSMATSIPRSLPAKWWIEG